MKPSGNLSCSCLIKLNLEFEKTGFPFFFLGESEFFFSEGVLWVETKGDLIVAGFVVSGCLLFCCKIAEIRLVV